MGWGNIYIRRMKVYMLALKVILDYKAVQTKAKWTKKSKRPGLWEKAHNRNGKRIVKLIKELNGLWVKLGQYLSGRADVLPPEYITLLKSLQDSLPPRPLHESNCAPATVGQDVSFTRAPTTVGRDVASSREKKQHQGANKVCQTIEKELGKSMEDLFKYFDKNPLATASIAQVHRAKLSDEQDVVVKVQHQGIKKIILEDLKDAKSIVDLIAWAEPLYDFNPILDEWCREAPKELDFNLEAGNFLVSKEAPHRPILLDFGLTKKVSSSMRQGLAKMLLAAAEGDHAALLSAMAEVGLKLRLDLPEQAMEVTTLFFRDSTPADEAEDTMKIIAELKIKSMKFIQEKMKFSPKEIKRFNPFDAFPGEFVMFSKVLTLLRGLSSIMKIHIVYLDILRPFAESVLQGNMNKVPTANPQWIYDAPIHSEVEAKLREFLVELGNSDKILGIQVCAYKDGEVIVDTAAGVLGRYDPRPVQPDSLFNVFSVTKGITAGLLHWLVDNGTKSQQFITAQHSTAQHNQTTHTEHKQINSK
ncbi:hypothetical protein Pint_05339 [Pistacia integerrima]|uniref:Uncharacterized protein n=1 Tax=Pistacia integerrima TaxID=434235 RepID=A0ACC0Z0S7_9ROSI|nr:hypothetical protein Pint_05339 [Pistacia integerrima]